MLIIFDSTPLRVNCVLAALYAAKAYSPIRRFSWQTDELFGLNFL